MREKQKTHVARRLRKEMTRAEVLLWVKLRREQMRGRFRRQHPVGPYIADFACIEAMLVIEVDGATHRTSEEIAYDARRTRFLESSGWSVVRVWNGDVVDNMDGVMRTIRDALWVGREGEG